MGRRLVVPALALLALWPVSAADAAFPGANGRIAYVHTRDNPDGTITKPCARCARTAAA